MKCKTNLFCQLVLVSQRSVKTTQASASASAPAAAGGSGCSASCSACFSSSACSLDSLLWVWKRTHTHTHNHPSSTVGDLHVHPLLPGLTGEEVKRLKNRVDALESITGTTSARSSRLSASSGINIIDPLDPSYVDRGSAGPTITRSDNGINLGAPRSGGGSWNGPGQDGTGLQRTVQQLVRAELRSDAVRGKTHWCINSLDSETTWSECCSNFCLLVETLAYSLKGEKGAPGPKGTFAQIILETDDMCHDIISDIKLTVSLQVTRGHWDKKVRVCTHTYININLQLYTFRPTAMNCCFAGDSGFPGLPGKTERWHVEDFSSPQR